MLCLSPFKQRLTRAETVSPSGHALSLSMQTETYPCWSCFSLWPCFMSLRSSRDLPVLKLVFPLAMLCLSPFKCRLTRAEAVSPSGHALSLSVQTETYPCWNCFSLWPRFVSLHANRDLPMLKLFLPLTMLCLSPFKQRLTRAEAVSPSGHALSLSVQTVDLPMLKLFLPLATLCLSPFKERLTHAEAVSPSGHTLSLSMFKQRLYRCWSCFSLWLCFCLSPFKQRLTHAEAGSPSGHALFLSIQSADLSMYWSCFSLWPHFVSLRSSADLPVLKLVFSLATLCLSPFKQRLTQYWSCFSLWPCYMSLRSSADLPVLKLVFPLAMLCLSPFK